MAKNLAAHARNAGLTPGLRRPHMPCGNEACVPHILSLCSRAQAPIRRRRCNEKPGRHNYREPTCGNADPVQPKVSVNKYRESERRGKRGVGIKEGEEH